MTAPLYSRPILLEAASPLNNRTTKAPLDVMSVEAGRNARSRETALSRESSLRTDTAETVAREIPAKLPKHVARLRDLVMHAVEDMKGREPVEIDIRDKASFADLLLVVSGTSTRHVRSIAEEVAKQSKSAGFAPIGVEGEREGEWVLVDLADIVVHVMLPRIREFYGLERLWQVGDVDDVGAVAVARAEH